MTDLLLSDSLCRHIAQTPFTALSPGAIHAAKRALLDAIGVMLGASGLCPETTPFVDIAREYSERGPCSILGHGATTSPAMAAFANGAMAQALDFEDAFDLAPSHPNACAIPAAIAMAQAVGPISGQDLIVATAIGCDLVCRLGLSLRQTMEQSGWYPPPILGAIGATAVTARLARLDAGQTRDALSLALMQAVCPGEIMHSTRTVLRSVREAFPARDAVTSALLAHKGVAGLERPLEGTAGFFRMFVDGHYDADVITERLGTYWWGEELSFKPWPACRGTHPYIEMGLTLRDQAGFDWRAIDAIAVDAGEVQQMLVTPLARKIAPETMIDAKFSIPFCLALALVHGRVDIGAFTPAMLADEDVLALARRISINERPDWGREKATWGALVMRLADGRQLKSTIEQPLGHPTRPLSDQQLIDKFVDCAGHAAIPLGNDDARSIGAMLLSIEDIVDVRTVLSLLD